LKVLRIKGPLQSLLVQPNNLHGFRCNDVAAESNPAGKDCISEGFRTIDDNIPGCHRGQTELLASMDIDGSKQCTVLAGNSSRVEALTARNLRPVKV
jgi:hypothetical protein